MTIALQSIARDMLVIVINSGGNVPIIQLPNNQPLPELLSCVICGRRIPPSDATAGLLDANNTQAFACNGHFWNRHQYITGWADFAFKQRLKLKRRGVSDDEHQQAGQGAANVWTFH
jgi:hypothetical protein